MMHGYQWARDMIKSYPLALVDSPNFEKVINRILPYNFAIEIETHFSLSHNEFLNKIQKKGGNTNFLNLEFDHFEQRFSFRGTPLTNLVNLYLVCEILKENYELNMDSGIHYHIAYDYRPLKGFDRIDLGQLTAFKNKILNRLDSWNYKGKYNGRELFFRGKGGWLCNRVTFKTLEFRIGEMTFDYELILKRIKECQQITHEFVRP